jgi:predicted GNAT family N-acyltransferase
MVCHLINEVDGASACNPGPAFPVESCRPLSFSIISVVRLEVARITTSEEMRQALLIRRRVFIEEQNVPEDLEIDEHDADPATVTTAVHVLVRLDGEPVATGRLLLAEPDGRLHIGRVAVLSDRRRYGLGRAVMEALHELAREHRAEAVTLAAQLHAIGFYERLGYRAYGDVFLDAGIEHRWMDLAL